MAAGHWVVGLFSPTSGVFHSRHFLLAILPWAGNGRLGLTRTLSAHFGLGPASVQCIQAPDQQEAGLLCDTGMLGVYHKGTVHC